MAVARHLVRPTRGSSIDASRRLRRGRSGPDLAAYLALLRLGVAVPSLLPGARWALTPPFHPCPALRPGGLFSVALSVASRRPGVTWQLALGARTFLEPATRAGPRPSRGDHGHNTCRDCRPMTLRHQVSLVLPFGQPVGLDQRATDFRCLALRHRLSRKGSSWSSSEHSRRHLADQQLSLAAVFLSWGYVPSRSIIKRSTITPFGYAIPLRP
jgi:hypothetical protein